MGSEARARAPRCFAKLRKEVPEAHLAMVGFPASGRRADQVAEGTREELSF